MLYTEKEKKRLRGFTRCLPTYIRESTNLEWFWSDKWAMCWLAIGAENPYIAGE